MFDDLRAAFREALENFNKELNRDQVTESADRLLVGMRDEIVDEKAQIAGLEDQLAKASQQSRVEQANGETCRRRERMAREIDDEETAAVAARHAEKHEGHHVLLQKKAAAIREELEFRQRTLDEMVQQFNTARSKRDSLAATSGRAQARESFSAADDLFGELDRMAEKIEGESARGEAAEEMDSIDFGGDSEYHVDVDEAPQPKEELDVDAALAELKRRMREQD